MSPRPRTATDQDILAATARVIAKVGPRFTLNDVAREIGLAPATLIQRFKSKRNMMLALLSSAGAESAEQYRSLRSTASSPLMAIFAYGECMAAMAPTPEELANHLAFLQIDLTDPDFYDLALAHSKMQHKEMRKMVEDAIASGELAATDAGRLASAILSMIGGSLIGWAIDRDGTAARSIRRDLETLLGPLRRPVGDRDTQRRAKTRRPAGARAPRQTPRRRAPAKTRGRPA